MLTRQRVSNSQRLLALCLAPIFASGPANPCERIDPVSSEEMVREADLIVRATADSYQVPPRDRNSYTTGVPDSVVRFEVREVIRGTKNTASLLLHGYLVGRDDFNDHTSPYHMVRPGGRAGSCFANSYRAGSEYLLILKKSPEGFTPYWYALGPVNEQLHSESDPWLQWVRKESANSQTTKKP